LTLFGDGRGELFGQLLIFALFSFFSAYGCTLFLVEIANDYRVLPRSRMHLPYPLGSSTGRFESWRLTDVVWRGREFIKNPCPGPFCSRYHNLKTLCLVMPSFPRLCRPSQQASLLKGRHTPSSSSPSRFTYVLIVLFYISSVLFSDFRNI